MLPNHEKVNHIVGVESCPDRSQPTTCAHCKMVEKVPKETCEVSTNFQNTISSNEKVSSSLTLDHHHVEDSKVTLASEGGLVINKTTTSTTTSNCDDRSVEPSAGATKEIKDFQDISKEMPLTKSPKEIKDFQDISKEMPLTKSPKQAPPSSGEKSVHVEVSPVPVAETVPVVTTTKSSSQKVLQEKGTLLQNPAQERPDTGHLPPAFDDVIHVIRHSSYRVGSEQPVKESVEMGVQNVDVGKFINVVRDDLEMRNITSPLTPLKSSSCSDAASLKSNISDQPETKNSNTPPILKSSSLFDASSMKSSISDYPGLKKQDVSNPPPLVSEPDSAEASKCNTPVNEEKLPVAKETLDEWGTLFMMRYLH